MKSIVFLDLDGTLWENEVVPESALEAIRLAQQNGHKILVNTGRTKCEAIDTLEPLHLSGYCFAAGSEIYIDDKTLVYDPLDVEVTKFIYNLLEEYHYGISFEGSRRTFCNFINRGLFLHEFILKPNSMAQLRFINCPSIDEMEEWDYPQVMKIYTFNTNQTPPEVLSSQFPEDVEWTHFKDNRGEITNSRHDKATAIKDVLDYFGYDYRTIAVGDSENDIPALKQADVAIVMGNGTEEVKKLADYVTTDIDKDGLYNAFKHYGLID